MLTCCPACRTCFRITEAQLAVAQGKVRCGKCKTVFNARQHLQPATGQSASAPSTAPQSPPTAPARDQTDHIDLSRTPQSEAHPAESGRDETASAGAPPAAADIPPEPEPSDTATAKTETDAVTSEPAADHSAPTTEVPFEPDDTPAASAMEQEAPLEAETESEPETVEIPMPDLDEMDMAPATESSVDTASMSKPEPEPEPESEPEPEPEPTSASDSSR
ncbi:MAG: zinc-ribbon domain-containing protein, partial [Thiohalophilus sp.]|uniref:MJ0042-type zinc finger domain-containing protein n=1 Tax=Thiohalophilus sp. TaxID=3028392 RepID=UPI0028705127